MSLLWATPFELDLMFPLSSSAPGIVGERRRRGELRRNKTRARALTFLPRALMPPPNIRQYSRAIDVNKQFDFSGSRRDLLLETAKLECAIERASPSLKMHLLASRVQLSFRMSLHRKTLARGRTRVCQCALPWGTHIWLRPRSTNTISHLPAIHLPDRLRNGVLQGKMSADPWISYVSIWR